MYNARKNISNLTYAKTNAEFATNKNTYDVSSQSFGINMCGNLHIFFN